MAAAAILAVLLSAAGTDAPADPGAGGERTAMARSAEEALGTGWRVIELLGTPLPDGVEITINFENGRMHGSSGCNYYGTDVTYAGNTFRIGRIQPGPKICDQESMTAEGNFIFNVVGATGYDISDDGLLTLTAGDAPVLRARR